MREIKFRVWDKKENCFLEERWKNSLIKSKFGFTTRMELILLQDELVFVQYTGLKDKNGKEIYEGDIINRESHVGFYVGFNEGSFVAIPINEVQRINWKHRPLVEKSTDYWEVTGNIYENPI